MSIPADYLERVYAGVLGKLVGVYLGRPFEGYFYDELMEELGPIDYYVHDKMNVPLVVTDDDVSGTFSFIRALEEHGVDLTSEHIGKTWLNLTVEKKSMFWWGGRGISTEHTAYHNLKEGIPAPDSGSISANGQTVAEQIGAQIFIDGWALVSPGHPQRAASYAKAAGTVSHDGEAVWGAMSWAAMEAEAFVSTDLHHLIDTGLNVIPSDCLIATVVSDVRSWLEVDKDWRQTRERIAAKYGYDKFSGTCHVIPNYAIMIMSLLYGGANFTKALQIVNSCGWDTDCNSGNLGCLVATMHGMKSFTGRNWLGPLADRVLISSADNGYSINNAARIAIDIANLGRKVARMAPLAPPKGGAQFHFTLPGSVQGFQSQTAKVHQEVTDSGAALAIGFGGPAEVMTATSAPRDYLDMLPAYPLCSSPLVYPGQTLRARFRAIELHFAATVVLRLKYLDATQTAVRIDSDHIIIGDKNWHDLVWKIPDSFESHPINQVGLAVVGGSGKICMDSFGWTGEPDLVLARPKVKPHTFWELGWIHSVTEVNPSYYPETFRVAQERGEGMISYGTREWRDYSVTINDFIIAYGTGGVAIRVQGLRRYYAVIFGEYSQLILLKVRDEERTVLATAEFPWKRDQRYKVCLLASGFSITGQVDGVILTAEDQTYGEGAMGCILTNGAIAGGVIAIRPT